MYMSGYFALDDDGKKDLAGSLSGFCRSLLEEGVLDALLVAQHLPDSPMVQHTLVRSPDKLVAVDPVAPVLPVSGGVLAARLTRQDPGAKVGALLRPCEIRAFFELVKLHQGNRDRILLIGMDCMGTFEPPQYREWAKANPGASGRFLEAMLDSGKPPEGAPQLRRCCRACEFPTGEGADLQLLFVGTDQGPCLFAGTEAGEAVMKALNLKAMDEPGKRSKAVETWVKAASSPGISFSKRCNRRFCPWIACLANSPPVLRATTAGKSARSATARSVSSKAILSNTLPLNT
jgi:formate dehydrogenase (coenzyme F420) beta subunit